MPQVLLNIALERKVALDSLPKTSARIKAVEKKLGEEGRVLVRWSGTEPKLRILVEGPDKRTIKRMAHEIAKVAEHEIG